MILNQREEILKFDWDTLIILDACRFDFFEQEYGGFLDGKLLKAESPASCTSNWMKAIWNNYYDLTYISTVPGVNGKGISVRNYNAIEHFKKVVDLWDHGWDDELGVVPPWKVNEAYESTSGRCVLHYMQPHPPYIGETKLLIPTLPPSPNKNNKLAWAPQHWIVVKDEAKAEYVRKAYLDNLRLVLEWLSELALKRTIITADHGELLGFKNPMEFTHPCGRSDPELRHVPWLEL